MASVKKEYIMMGISTILIPLGTWVFKKIASKGIDKLNSKFNADENNHLPSSHENEIIPPKRR